MPSIRSRGSAALLATLLVLSTAGCSSTPKPADVVGTWLFDAGSSRFDEPESSFGDIGAQGTIEFRSDDTFESSGIPFGVLPRGTVAEQRTLELISLNGSWSIGDDRVGFSDPYVQLKVDPAASPGYPQDGTSLYLEVGSELGNFSTLFFYLDDPDSGNRYSLEKD